MEFPCEQHYAFCEAQAGHGVGASARRRARFLSAKYLMLVLAGFDEYDVSPVQEQKAGLGACPAKEKGPGSIGKHVRKPSSGVELLCLSLVGISSSGLNSVMILTH
jgi:hypothetical protein